MQNGGNQSTQRCISHVIALQEMHLKLPSEIQIVIAPADHLFLQLLCIVFKYWHSADSSRLVQQTLIQCRPKLLLDVVVLPQGALGLLQRLHGRGGHRRRRRPRPGRCHHRCIYLPPRPASSCRRSLSIHESIPWRSEFAMKITSGLAGVGTTANPGWPEEFRIPSLSDQPRACQGSRDCHLRQSNDMW